MFLPESLLTSSLTTRNSFIGCIRNFMIDEKTVSFSKAALVSGAVSINTCPAAWSHCINPVKCLRPQEGIIEQKKPCSIHYQCWEKNKNSKDQCTKITSNISVQNKNHWRIKSSCFCSSLIMPQEWALPFPIVYVRPICYMKMWNYKRNKNYTKYVSSKINPVHHFARILGPNLFPRKRSATAY